MPISAKVPAELADAVRNLADAGDRTLSREVARAIAERVQRSAGGGSPTDLRIERRAPGPPAVEAQALAGEAKR